MPVLHVTLPGSGSSVPLCAPLAPRSQGPLFQVAVLLGQRKV